MDVDAGIDFRRAKGALDVEECLHTNLSFAFNDEWAAQVAVADATRARTRRTDVVAVEDGQQG